MYFIRIILGLLCLAGAFGPGILAGSLLNSVILPKLTAGSNVYIIHQTIVVAGYHIHGWQLYAVPLVLALIALGLAGAGLFLIASKRR